MPRKSSNLVKIQEGQPVALRPIRSLEDAIAAAVQAEAALYGIPKSEVKGMALSAVAIPVDIGLPDVRVEMPRGDEQIHDAFATCERIARENPRIGRTLDAYIDAQLTSAIDYKTDEEGEPIPATELAVYRAWLRNTAPGYLTRGVAAPPARRLPFKRLAQELLINVWQDGNSFPSLEWYPRRAPDGQIVDLPYVTPLDPNYTYVNLDAFRVGIIEFEWRVPAAPADSRDRIIKRWADFIPKRGPGSRSATFYGKTRPLPSQFMDQLTYHKARHLPYGTPVMVALLQAAGQREQLNQMDFALANASIALVYLVRVGTEKMVVSQRHIDLARDALNDPKRTMALILPHWYAIEVVQPNTEGLNSDKYAQSNIETAQGLGLALTGDPQTDLLFTEHLLTGLRDEVVLDYLNNLFEQIADRNEFERVPQARMNRVELTPQRDVEDVMHERGVMSTTTYAARRGLDWTHEDELIQKEPKAEPAQVPFSSPQIGAGQTTGGNGGRARDGDDRGGRTGAD